jgi:hypothetical protein
MGSRLKRRKAPENTAQVAKAEDRCAPVLLCVVLLFEVDVKFNLICSLKTKAFTS